MKRLLDLSIAFFGLLFLSPVLLIFLLCIFLQDKKSPFYKAPRVGINGEEFIMVKMRSMIFNADDNKVQSTSSDDNRITRLGKIIRKFKLDEITQLWNILLGDMSLVGPRPQVRNDVDLYSDIEMQLLSVLPGITDFSSIVFSDEGDILKGKSDPDLSYNQLIRPWKSKLGILYINNQSLLLDIRLILYTLVAIIRKEKALEFIGSELKNISNDMELIKTCQRKETLQPAIPPGHEKIVESR